jgi:glucan phosphoethanolaminetransferase (alkaline phosphatase superfamily)
LCYTKWLLLVISVFVMCYTTTMSEVKSSHPLQAWEQKVLGLATPLIFPVFHGCRNRSLHCTLFYVPVKMLHSSSSWFLIFLLINLYSIFPIFHSHLSVLTSNLFPFNHSCTFYAQNIPICLFLSVQQIPIAVSKLLMVDSKSVCNM